MSNVESRTAQAAGRQGPQPLNAAMALGATPWIGDPALRQVIEHELVPRLLLAHRAGPFAPIEHALLARTAATIHADDREIFLEYVLGDDEDASLHFMAQLAARGVAIEALCLDLLAPTAQRLGTMWEEDERDFFEVTVALGRVQRALRDASRRAPAPEPARGTAAQVLLTSLPGEQHTLGLAMVAEFFVRDGWSVHVGAPASNQELLDLVREGWLDVVGFSVTCESRLLTVRREIATARRVSKNPNLVILVGGRTIAEHPELVAHVGADGYADSAADAPARARELIGRPAH